MPKLLSQRFLPLLFLAGILFLVLYAQFLSPYEGHELLEVGKLQPPSWAHPFGTDHLGRDLLTRCGAGAKGSLLAALGIVAVGASLGGLLGGLAGYHGGFVDACLSRVNESLLAFPGMLLALMLVTVMGRGMPSLILALGLAFTPSYARLARGECLRLRQRPFILRMEVMGAHPIRIMGVHLLPLLKAQWLNAVGIGLANAMLAESGMSFLGFGIHEPAPSWGALMAEAQAYFLRAPWMALFPGLCIVLTVFAIFGLHQGERR